MPSTIIRFPKDNNGELLDALRKSAKKNRRSLNSEMLRAFEFYLKSAPDIQRETKPVDKEVSKKKSPK
jgi:Arc-like DNA binding domain.